MNTTLFNILSNAVARLWSIGISIILLPIYINIIGMEAYGLVGFYSTLLGSLAILDLGLSSTLSREMARSQALNMSAQSVNNLVYSLEIIYWMVGICIGIGIIILAPFIATYWVKAEHLSIKQLTNAIMIMGGVVAFQWPQSIYTGGLMGLQRQVAFNIANVILATLKNVGVIFVLKWVSSSIEAFFFWQIIMSALTAFTLRYLLWHFTPKMDAKRSFSLSELKRIWRFAAGMTGISLASFSLSQIDKVVLSKLLSLKDYGYYTLAWTVGTSILLVVGILGNTLLPKMTEIIARGNQKEIVDNYHRFNRLVASTVIPVGVLICLFSKEILLLWTHSPETTNAIWLAVSILTIGSVCNSFMHIPYYAMLAKGITRFTIYQNVIASLILTPLLFWWTYLWGFKGATLVWFCVNFGYTVISLPLVHKFYLPEMSLRELYVKDIGIALGISLIIIGLAKYLSMFTPSVSVILFMGCGIGFVYVGIVLASKEYLGFINIATRKLRLKYGK